MSNGVSGGFAGTLSERVTLVRRAATRDDLGGASDVWANGATLWAAVRPDGEGTGDDAGAARRWVITLRATVQTIGADRLRWGERTLRVRRVEPDPREPERIVLRTEEIR